MNKILRTGLLISLFLVLAGCAGRNFVRPSADAFKLGQTSYAQVVQQLGEPRRGGDVLKNEKQVKTISYAYATTGGDPLEQGVTPARVLVYYFHNEVLVGQEFLSSFKSDNSNFDDVKINAIAKGTTTRSEVSRLFGNPSASYIFPMVKQTSGEAIGYGYHTTRGGAFSGFKFFSKNLRVSFDDRGVVSDIEYTSSGTK